MRILLATDGSANADAALEVVLYRPWEEGTSIQVISVMEPMHDKINSTIGFLGLGKIADEARQKLLASTTTMVAKYADRLTSKFGAEHVSSAVVEGKIKQKIVEEAKKFNADTIVIGAHGQKEVGLFGSTPDFVLSHANCSVEILRAASLSTMLTEIERQQPVEEDKYLIALDDSTCSEATMANVLSRRFPPKSFFKIVSVVEPLPFQAYSGLGPWEGTGSEEYVKLVNKTLDAEKEIARKVVAEATAKIKERFPDADVSGEVLEGYAKDQIIEMAKNWPADLLIMGSHGRGGFMDLVLGSVSKASATHAPCSVLVVRPHAKK